ncbi:MAG: hypothetical protein VR65_22795 [Desulfobulbaceae bacterium BRH_c16a]|nr:MAG: hypothetical protein VR65_22795 [Desulfobulbaceae bacterium BRH_c16a]
MAKKISRFKPAVSRSTLLFLSALLWTMIGLLLLVKGGYRWFQLPQWQLLIAVTAFAAGSLKALFILDTSARRAIERILHFQDGTCLGAVYSVKTWILVLCMMSMGVILRSYLPVQFLCFLLLTIGWALLLSSRLAWRAWFKRG